MADTVLLIHSYGSGSGDALALRLKDNGDGTYSLGTTATLAGDVEIGAVELKDATDNTRAKVAATGAVAEGNNAVAVQAPVLGATTGAAIVTDANGTIQQYLRGLVKLLAAKITVILDAGTNIVGGTKDAGPQWTSVHGVAGVPFTSADQHSVLASITDAPTSGQKLVVTDIVVSVDTAMSVTFKEETAGNAVVIGPVYMAANSTLQLTPRGKLWKLSTADKKLQVITSVAGNIMVDAGYYSEV